MDQVRIRLLAAGLLALVWLWALLRRRSSLRDTTLVAPWCWSIGSLVVTTCAVLWLLNRGDATDGWSSHVLYLAGTTSFCPLMALLGAKRPQDGAWQFVVLTLLIVLLLPSGEALLYRPGAMLELHAARGWFLWILIGLGLFNAIATRHWLATLLTAAGQVLLLAGQLPLVSERLAPQPLVALALFVGAALLWSFDPWPSRGKRGWDRAWLDFRDAFGTLWALRVAERFNAAAHQYGWSLRLRWTGFVAENNGSVAPAPPSALNNTMQVTLWGLLRRFVSPEWLDARVDCTPLDANLD